MAGPAKSDVTLRVERPRLLVHWAGGWPDFREGLRALWLELPPLAADAQAAFRDAEVVTRRRRWAYPLSAALHLLLWVTPVPEFFLRPPSRAAALPPIRIEYDLKWTGTSRMLPPLSPTSKPKRAPGPGGKKDKPLPRLGADGVAAQTIISNPPQPNHPRQTLLRPNALEDARLQTVDVRLPNMVIPPAPASSDELDLRRLQIPGLPVDLSGPPRLRAPSRLRRLEGLRLPLATLANPTPRLEVTPATEGENLAASAATDLPPGVPRSGDQLVGGLIALSAQPAAPGPVLELPNVNLHARFAVGPHAGPGSPVGVPEGVLGGEGGEGEGPGGEAGGLGGGATSGIFIAPAGPVPPGPVVVGPTTGNGNGSAAAASPPPVPRQAESTRPVPPAKKESFERADDMLRGMRAGGQPPERGRRVYTIYINMPNLASQSGSWVLRFAEKGEESGSAAGGASESPLEAPVPVKKVDPGYASAARRDRIEGSVVLYGVIRPDGTVEDVQVVRGLYAALDQRAVEAFQRWHFEPGRKNGAPVALEVVVEIPFRLQGLF